MKDGRNNPDGPRRDGDMPTVGRRRVADCERPRHRGDGSDDGVVALGRSSVDRGPNGEALIMISHVFVNKKIIVNERDNKSSQSCTPTCTCLFGEV